MAMLGSILFNRTLKQFLECKDLESDKGVALTDKLRQSAKDSIDRLLQVIPETAEPHSEVLRKICLEHVESGSEDLFIGPLDRRVDPVANRPDQSEQTVQEAARVR